MKKLLLLCLTGLCGCAMISGQQGDVKVTSWRFFWQSEAIDFSTKTTNGVAALKVGKSGTDDKAVAAAVAAAVSAAIKSAK